MVGAPRATGGEGTQHNRQRGIADGASKSARCSGNTVFHECKLLKREGMINCRSRVHFDGSVERKKVVTRNCAIFTRFSTEAVEDDDLDERSFLLVPFAD